MLKKTKLCPQFTDLATLTLMRVVNFWNSDMWKFKEYIANKIMHRKNILSVVIWLKNKQTNRNKTCNSDNWLVQRNVEISGLHRNHHLEGLLKQIAGPYPQSVRFNSSLELVFLANSQEMLMQLLARLVEHAMRTTGPNVS